jgi:hypothetical protein
MENTVTQHKKQQYDWLKPYQWEKGQSGNPQGGKKGKRLKTMVAEMFEKMSDEEKKEFLNHIDPEVVWKMAEGNPKQDTEVSGEIQERRTIIIVKESNEAETSK